MKFKVEVYAEEVDALGKDVPVGKMATSAEIDSDDDFRVAMERAANAISNLFEVNLENWRAYNAQSDDNHSR